MSEPIICPICETSNPPGAINCEVCGERLAPPQPGEEIPPEQNMAAQLQQQAPTHQPPPNEAPPVEESPAGGEGATFDPFDEEGELPLDETFDQGYIEPAQAPIEPEERAMHTEEVEEIDASGDAGTLQDAAPDVLYSHMTGEAFHPGSPEYEEGFGPMGEQLHPTPPLTQADEQVYDPPTDPEVVPEDYADEQQTFEEASPSAQEEPPPLSARENAFQPTGPNPAAKLPTPGPHTVPATLTVYFQKQPVLEYAIETDEVLIGRKDIRADIHPEIDLTTWDHGAFVSRKHAYIYRQNKNYTLYAVSNGGLQLNNDLLELGDRKQLQDGDIIVVAGVLAMKFALPDSNS